MVKNFNKFYKSRSKEKSSKSRSYNDKRSSSRERNCYNCGKPGHYSNECTTPYKRREDSPKRRSKREESPPRERRSRYGRYERRTSRRSKDSERKDKLQEEIDAFEEAPKALVKWVPKTTSSSTSSSTTTTPRIPINMVWIPKKKK